MGKKITSVVKSLFSRTQQHFYGSISGYGSCADPGDGGGGGIRGSVPPLENHRAIEFVSNTGAEPLENHKATKSAFTVGPLSARQ